MGVLQFHMRRHKANGWGSPMPFEPRFLDNPGPFAGSIIAKELLLHSSGATEIALPFDYIDHSISSFDRFIMSNAPSGHWVHQAHISDVSNSDSELMKHPRTYSVETDGIRGPSSADDGSGDSLVAFDYGHADTVRKNSPIKAPTPANKPGKDFATFKVSFSLYTVKSWKGPVKTHAKQQWIAQKFPITDQQIPLKISSIAQLKGHLFTISDKITANSSGGMSALFKIADAKGKLSLGVYIINHSTYGKGKGFIASEDIHVVDFFRAVGNSATGEVGIMLNMDNPTRAALQEVEKRSLAHAVLAAQNVVEHGRETTQDKLDHSDPVDQRKMTMTKLIMMLTFEHMLRWAKALAKGIPGVTLNDPPSEAGFVWESVKRELLTTTPVTSAKRLNTGQRGFKRGGGSSQANWGYSEMQDMDIEVDLDVAKRLAENSTIHDYVAFAKVPFYEVDQVTEAFENNGIEHFFYFLFPSTFDARDMARWGIRMGTGLSLMRCARQFYQHLVDKEEGCSRNKGVVSLDSDSDADITVMPSRRKSLY